MGITLTESKRVLVTGVTGQDGGFMARLLLGKGYEVHGLVRRHATPQFGHVEDLVESGGLTFEEGDLGDSWSLRGVLQRVRPDEVYNMGAQSFVGVSFSQPELTGDITGLGPLRLFEAVRQACPSARVYQASSSECFGNVMRDFGLHVLDEGSPMVPASPYGSAKCFAHHTARIYRESYGLYIVSGILHNHESEHRGTQFVTRKITSGLARIKHGLQSKKIQLGNLDAVRDWGYAPEYMDACYKMLQQETPQDFLIATGMGYTVREFLEFAFMHSGLDGAVTDYVDVVPGEKRPMDIDRLVGNPAKAKAVLGWEAGTRAPELAKIMMLHDLKIAEAEAKTQ